MMDVPPLLCFYLTNFNIFHTPYRLLFSCAQRKKRHFECIYHSHGVVDGSCLPIYWQRISCVFILLKFWILNAECNVQCPINYCKHTHIHIHMLNGYGFGDRQRFGDRQWELIQKYNHIDSLCSFKEQHKFMNSFHFVISGS